MRFSDFLAFDSAAAAVYGEPSSQHRFRDCLKRLSETARRHPGKFMVAEAAKKDVRRGVAFRQKALDDPELGVFAQRLADRLWGAKSATNRKEPKKRDQTKSNYGEFLHSSVLAQGRVLGDMQWETWEVTKKALELGGVDPKAITDPKTTPAERQALVGKINWQNVTLPALKAKLGSSFQVPPDWKRQLGIDRLKRIKAAVEQGQPLAAPHERKLLGIWKTLEVQLYGGEGQPSQILPAEPKSDVNMTKLQMSPDDRTRFYKTLTGTNESVATPLQLSPQSAYDWLTQYGVEVVTDEEAKDLYLTRILLDLKNKNAFIPSTERGGDADAKRWRDSAARSWGGFVPAARGYDPSKAPGVAQRLAGMTTRGHKTRTNPSGRRVPYAYPEPEDFTWPGEPDEVPGIKFVIDAPSQEVSNDEINSYYRSGTPEANAAVERELLKPARDAVNWLRHKGWIDDPSKIDDYTQDVVMGMMGRTGAVANWRDNVGFRRTTASMLARRYASQGWPSATRERTGHLGGEKGEAGALHLATGSTRLTREDDFNRIQGSAAKARKAIQHAVASILDVDTSAMHDDEEQFVDALDSLSDPDRAIDALAILDRLSSQYATALPQVKKAVDRIKRHLDPLMSKMRGKRWAG